MSGHIVHVGATLTCPHMGTVTAITSNTRVMVSGLCWNCTTCGIGLNESNETTNPFVIEGIPEKKRLFWLP